MGTIRNILIGAAYIWEGHVANWPWLPRDERYLRRCRARGRHMERMLKPYIPYIRSLAAPYFREAATREGKEPLFMLWLQGEENAPEIVKTCMRRARKLYPDRLVTLDSENVARYASLPAEIEEKWKRGKIKNAHYSDMLRLELLYRHGGYWFDSTDLLTGPIPDSIEKADFFLYVTDPGRTPHMPVQNCFIRARRQDPLLTMWRNLALEFWKRETYVADYFMVQTMLKMLVTHNDEARRLYDRMPKTEMYPMLTFWHEIGNLPYDRELVEKMKEEIFFQKCTYRRRRTGVNGVIPGSVADHILNGKEE